MRAGLSAARLGALLLFAAVLASPATAAAQDDGVVRVPSDSPAGAEYAVPLDDARRTGDAPDSGRGAQSVTETFGRGLSPESEGGAASSSSSDSSAAPSSSSGASGKEDDATTPTTPAATSPSGPTVDDSSPDATTESEASAGGLGLGALAAIIAVAFAVLTGGAGLLRRRAR